MGEAGHDRKRRRRQATLYDAIAGRVTSEGFMFAQGRESTSHNESRLRSLQAVTPEEALYRQNGAPLRYHEDDEYDQHRHLTPDQRLPDSDLLKIIHTYAADFYARTSEDGGAIDQKSLDETALLAMGILLEEAAAKIIGKTGHLALLDRS